MEAFAIGLQNDRGIHCIFEDDGDTGYLYLSDHGGAGIIDDLQIYSHPQNLGVEEKDIEIVWSRSGDKCGVKIWGNFYGIFDLTSKTKLGVLVNDKDTPPISDPALINGF